jgi:ribosomal protein L37AE/L43A
MGRTASDPAAGPKSFRQRYKCPNPECKHAFTRRTRLGIYATCPKCKTRVYGPKVLSDLAGHAATATVNGSKAKPKAKPPTTPAAATAERLQKPKTESTPPPPAKREPSLWERLLGAGDA